MADWQCIPRNYAVTKNFLQAQPAFKHPLIVDKVVVVETKRKNSHAQSKEVVSLETAADPLSHFAKQQQELQEDPLSEMAGLKILSKSKGKDTKSLDMQHLKWSNKRLSILNRYTTSEKLSITTSFLSASTGAETIKSQTVVANKTKFRLEQLDNFEDGSMQQLMNLSQQEYIHRIELLNQELITSWNSDQRVKALKIAIQCAKMLSDTAVLSFYPSQFVLITDILDMFGKLVYERLKSKSIPDKNEHNSEILLERAKETCLNWFYKIASIRELLPRLYVEMALLQCYEFMPQSNYKETLQRLTEMIRGIADPLIAAYARCYLVRVGVQVSYDREFIRLNIHDFLDIYHVMFSGITRSEVNRQNITIADYLALYEPFLDYMILALVYKNPVYMEEMTKICQEQKNNAPLLLSCLHTFDPEYIAGISMDFAKLLCSTQSDGASKSQLLRALGICISQCTPILQEQRLPFWQLIENTINSFKDPAEYITCMEMWTQFVAESLDIVEINNLLKQIHQHMLPGKAYAKHYTQLLYILDKLLQFYPNVELLLTQENFLPFLDLFHKDSIKIQACKRILEIFQNQHQLKTSDAIVTNALMYIGKILNDSVNALTVEDERRQISQLISSFVRQVDHGRDFEQQLSFYVEARSNFSNLDGVYCTLVHAVNKLAIETQNIVQGQHSAKTAAFVRACVAYCFITIPSIASIQNQLDLYLLSGQVALLNMCLGQADSCFEAALKILPDLPRFVEIEGKPKSLETYLSSYLSNFLSTLVVVPDCPEQGVLYLLRLLLESVSKYHFEPHSCAPAKIYLNVLDCLYVQSLENFPYHIPQVVSNDELYGHDVKFLNEVNSICFHVVELILMQLQELGSAQQYRNQGILTLELFERMVRYADLSKEKTFQLALKLWLLALKLETHLDSKILLRSRKTVEDIYQSHLKVETEQSVYLAELLKRMRK